MKRISRVAAGTLGFILIWTSLAVGAQPLSSYNFLRDVSVDRKNGELLIRLEFRKPLVHFQGPVFFKKSIQMDFPAAYVDPSKRYFDTGDDEIRQVYVSQFDRKKLRLRLILASGVQIFKDRVVVEQLGNVLRIRISKDAPVPIKREFADPLASLLARANRIQSSKIPKTKTTSGQLAKTEPPVKVTGPVATGEVAPASAAKEFKKASPPLSKILGQAWKNKPPKEASPATPAALKTQQAGILDFGNDLSAGKPDLFSASLKMAYTLVLVLGLMFLVYYFFKKFGLKNTVFGGEGRPIKVLSTGFLAPRKSIALVEVAGDILVLGIAHDRISLLSNVQDPEKIERIKTSLNKKNARESKIVSSPPQREGGKPQAEKQGVDVYKKRLVKSGSTNSFGEYVKKFTDSPDPEPASLKGVAPRVRKKMEEVPVFE